MIQALVTYLESTEDVAKFAQSGYGSAFSFGNSVVAKKDPLAKAEVSTGWTFEQILMKSLLHNLNIGQTVYMLSEEGVVEAKVAFLGKDEFITEDKAIAKYSDLGVTWFVDESSAKKALEESEAE